MTSLAPADAASAPQVIAGRYQVLGELGSGGAGTVYRVVDTRTGTQVALKCMRRDLADARLSARFQHEYYTLTQLAHPRIVSVYDYGVCELGLYYTMELLDGLDVREAAPLPPVEVCRLLRDVASALAVLHARRLLHRDISYRKVRCTASGHAKLLDFGAMMAIGSTTEVIGTRPFIPPESVQRGELDARSDLYSLGALAYWMLTARHAYPASSLVSLQQLWASPPPPAPSAITDGVSVELDQLVMSLMCLQPQGRPASAAEVMDRLGAIANLPPAEDLRVAEAYLTRPALVGRERELKRIREYFTADAPRRGPLTIEGSQGLGKTRLLEELLIDAKLAGAVTVSVAGNLVSSERYAVAHEIVKQLWLQLPTPLAEVSGADRALLATEFPEFVDGATPANEAVPLGELRHRMQGALMRWLGNVGRNVRLVIVVDDFQSVDEHSAGVLAALAADRTEGNVRLAVGLLEQQAAATAAVRLLRQFATKIALRRLRQVDVAQLIDGIFGDVPNSGRVAHWLYGRTRGNPLECMELARYLVERELVHYAEGTWMLPASLPEALPLGLQATRTARVAALPPTQRCLAEALAVFGSPAPLSVCAELAEVDASTALHCLQALIRLELLTLQGDEYAYHSESLRQAIDSSVAPERSAELHEQAGQLLQRRGATDLRTALRAAQHLMRGRSQRQGADMIHAIACDPSVGRDVGEFFTAPLELALGIYREQQLGPGHTTPLLARLLTAAFMYDRNLVRHADALLPQLKHDAGFDLAVPGERGTPEWLSSVLALARQRHEALPVAQRGLPPEEAVAMLSSVAGAVLAAAILKWDSRLIEAVWDVVEPLAKLGSGAALAVAPELVGFYVAALRVGEACNHEQRMAYIERLRDPGHYPSLAKDRRLSILATQLHNVGMATSVLDGDTALRLADEIDGFGLQMYQGAALQVRLMVFMYRGQVAQAQQCRARLDVLAVQGGAGTQFELWLAPYLADPHALWDDVIGLKQASSHLRRVAAADPGYEPMALVALGHYHRARGDHRRALTVFERACALAPRDRHASWLLALSGRIDTLVEAGAHAEALALGEQLHSSLSYGARFSELVEQRLARALALARAELGDIPGAIRSCEDAIARELALGKSPLHLGRLHEARARIALLQGDEVGFAEQRTLMQRYFAQTRNPLLISRCERLAAAARARLEPRGQVAVEGELDVAQVVSMLTGLETQRERARCALELIQREAGVDSGYLYLTRGEELELITGPMEDAPEGLGPLVSTFFQGLRQRSDATETLAPESKSACDTLTLSCGARAFMPLPLGMTLHNRRAVFGMVVLSVDEPSLPTARQLRVLETVARALYDLGDVGDAS